MAREQVWDAVGGVWVTVSGVASVVSSNTDANAIHDNVAAEISAIAEKTVPTTSDLIVIEDAAVSNAKKRVQIGNLPFDTFPVGGMMMYGAASAPSGWLLCDGSAVSQATYAALYAVIGLTYGNPGGGNFNLPDLRQRFPMGKAVSGTGSTLGGTGGAIDHVHSGPSHIHTMPTHIHTMPTHIHTQPTHNHFVSDTTSVPSGSSTVQSGSGTVVASTQHTHSTSDTSTSKGDEDTGATDPGDTNAADAGDTNAAGTGNTGTANPPFQTVNFIIKT